MAGRFLSIIARLAIAFVCLLPIRLAAQLGRGCGNVMFYLDGRHRRVAIKNLKSSFADSKSDAEIAEIARENFRRIGENICCAIKSTSLDDAALSELLEVDRSASP